MPITIAVSDVALGDYRVAEGAPLAACVDAFKLGKVEACGASTSSGLLRGRGSHAFVALARFAFHRHLPLSISPDTIWLLLAQGLANHVNANPEEHRAFFVEHAGKERLAVRNDALVAGDPASPWDDVLRDFDRELKDRLGKRHDLVVADFTTTGPVERLASVVVLMDAVQSYFTYVVDTLCGIPAITLEGTADDWRSIRTRVQVFRELGLGWWIDALEPVLQGLIATAEGRGEVEFWRSFYREHDVSGGTHISGWVRSLFPYLKGAIGARPVKNPFVAPPRWDVREPRALPPDELKRHKALAQLGPEEKDLPSSLARAPFLWRCPGGPHPMAFVAGLVTATQTAETGLLRPVIGWAVVHAVADG